jgi:hypothetical protein
MRSISSSLNVAFAAAGVASEERGAVVHLCNAAAELRGALHLGEHVGQEHQLPVARARNQAVFGVASVFDDEAGVFDAVLAAHAFEIALPALAVGRIRQHEIEFA